MGKLSDLPKVAQLEVILAGLDRHSRLYRWVLELRDQLQVLCPSQLCYTASCFASLSLSLSTVRVGKIIVPTSQGAGGPCPWMAPWHMPWLLPPQALCPVHQDS